MTLRLLNHKLRFTILIVVLLILLFSVPSCLIHALTYGEYEFLHVSESYETMTIQIVEISEGYSSCTLVNTDELNGKLNVIATIEDKESFMKEFQKVDHNYPLGTPPFGLQAGKAILLTYSDGKKELISRAGCALIEGEITNIQYHGWFVMDDYNEWIEKWLPKE